MVLPVPALMPWVASSGVLGLSDQQKPLQPAERELLAQGGAWDPRPVRVGITLRVLPVRDDALRTLLHWLKGTRSWGGSGAHYSVFHTHSVTAGLPALGLGARDYPDEPPGVEELLKCVGGREGGGG